MPIDDSQAAPTFGDVSGEQERTLPLDPVRRIGDYQLIEEIGRGGMGIVFAARRDDSDTVVAVKLLSGHGTDDPKFRLRFLREARTAAAMTHPNIARVHGVFEDGPLLYIVMDYIAGGTLRRRIKHQQVSDLDWVIRIAKQVAQGLAAAHQAGVIHRDIKPSNILLDPPGDHAWIADFGLAVFELGDDSLTSTGHPLGTPAYMSPEQAQGDRVDKRSDLFSLGCLIYAMVTGESPFHASNMMAVLRRLVEFNPPSLTSRNHQVPAALSLVVDRLLRKNPDERYERAEDVVTALERCEAALKDGLLSSDVSDLTRTVPIQARARRRALTTGVVVLVGLAAMPWVIPRLLPRPSAESQKMLPSAPPLASRSRPAPGVGPTAESSPRAKSAPAPREGRRRTVAVGQPADFVSLHEALSAAQPYDIIEVLDQATYEGPFVIDDPYQLEGVQLTSRAGATLKAGSAEGRLAVLTIDDTRRVRVSGFRIVGAPELHTVSLSGDVSGTLLSELWLQQSADTQWANVLLARECRGTADEPVTIRQCRLQSGKFGIFSGRTDVTQALELSHLLVDGNYFSGPGMHIVLLHAASEIRIEHNIFHQGQGIEFHLESPRRSGPFSVCNNTFYETDGWIHFGPDRGDYQGTACNNLIIASNTQPSVDELGARRPLWHVHHNVWESSSSSADRVVDGFGLTTRDAGLRSRDPGSSTFLRPSVGGIAASRGAGAPLPGYVGARQSEQ